MPKAAAISLQQMFARAIESIDEKEGTANVDSRLLELLAKHFRCQWATFWKVDPQNMRLRAADVWREQHLSSDVLDRATFQRQLSLSEGTAGHVWRSRKPVWSTNIVRDMCLPRSLDATSADLHGGIWFAVKTDDAVYGVVEMLGYNLEPVSEEIVVLIEQVGISLGRLLEAAHMKGLKA